MYKTILSPPKNGCDYWPESQKTSRFAFFRATNRFEMGVPRALKFAELKAGKLSNLKREIYIPVCENCPTTQYCISARINFSKFAMTDSQRYKHHRFNQHLEKVEAQAAVNDPGMLKLYRQYLEARHGEENSMLAYTEEKFKSTFGMASWAVIARDDDGALTAAFFIDQHEQAFSGEYLIYDPKKAKLSPGISMMLACVDLMRKEIPDGHLYLGSWSNKSPKLDYKKQFGGMEYHLGGQWITLDDIKQKLSSKPPTEEHPSTAPAVQPR